MSRTTTKIWNNTLAQQLATALFTTSSLTEMENFLRDVMTENEIIEISSRLEAARLLQIGEKYKNIVEQTKLSSRTVARISDWLQNGSGGYAAVLANLDQKHEHISPVSAD